MMKSNQRVPLHLGGGTSHRSKGDFDEQTLMTKQSIVSAPPSMHTNCHNPPSGSTKKHHQNHGRRRASTSFVPNTHTDADDGFGAFPEDPFVAPISSHSRGKKGSTSRRNSTDGSAHGDTACFGGNDPFASFASHNGPSKPSRSQRRKSSNGTDDFASFDAFGDAPATKSKPAPPAPKVPTPAPSSEGRSEAFPFSTSSHRASIERTNSQGEIALPPLVGSEKQPNKSSHKENPLLSIPDPISQQQLLQQQAQQEEQDFFAEMAASKGNSFPDSAFGSSMRFSDEDNSDGELSDDGTILWKEGGTIVSKAEKYSRSCASLNTSFLSSSSGNLRFDQDPTSSHTSSRKKPPRTTSMDRKRLDGLERRNPRGTDDDLTTATPSTRFSTDSEYSRDSNCRSKNNKGNAPVVELKTGSLLNDLVLIMDGKMELPGVKEGESSSNKNSKEFRSSRRRSAVGNDSSAARQSRRSATSGSSGHDSSDPFVVKQEVRGENMKSFSRGVSRSKSGELESMRRKPPLRAKSGH